MKRVLSALVLVPAMTYVILWAPEWLFFAVVSVIALICFHEYSGIVAAQGIEAPGILGYAAGLMLLFVRQWELLFVTVLALGALALALRFADLTKSLLYSSALLLGVLYIFGAWRCAFGLRAASPHWLFFALVLNWVGDTAAYYVGRKFGRHKLAPVISPKKSKEGAAASICASMLFGVLYMRAFLPDVPVLDVLVLAALANMAGQIGDMAESALKRGAGVKDSGTLLPGHGGWLDRVDSSLFAMPVVYLYALHPWSAFFPA
jgi:phosphatidate cytidylyltransferase